MWREPAWQFYRISEINDKGEYTYTEEDLVTEWITSSEEKRHLITGLTAGCSYVLAEKKAPEGYALMEPVLFTLKEDGRGISSISNSLSLSGYITEKRQPKIQTAIPLTASRSGEEQLSEQNLRFSMKKEGIF